MAAVKLPYLIALEQNTNDESTAYGKYYGVTYCPQKTLGLRGLIERVAFDQSVYTPDIVEGVIKRLTTVMCEQLQAGESIKWDGLGTFKPYIDGQKGGRANLVDAVKDINNMIKGVHIRFIPENVKGEKLTSRAFRDACTLQLARRPKSRLVAKTISSVSSSRWRHGLIRMPRHLRTPNLGWCF